MSVCLSSKDGVKARKRHRCAFCFEPILPGEIYDKRAGACVDGIWTMYMHPECHALEDDRLTAEDYEDMSDPFWTRDEAIKEAEKRKTMPCPTT